MDVELYDVTENPLADREDGYIRVQEQGVYKERFFIFRWFIAILNFFGRRISCTKGLYIIDDARELMHELSRQCEDIEKVVEFAEKQKRRHKQDAIAYMREQKRTQAKGRLVIVKVHERRIQKYTDMHTTLESINISIQDALTSSMIATALSDAEKTMKKVAEQLNPTFIENLLDRIADHKDEMESAQQMIANASAEGGQLAIDLDDDDLESELDALIGEQTLYKQYTSGVSDSTESVQSQNFPRVPEHDLSMTKEYQELKIIEKEFAG